MTQELIRPRPPRVPFVRPVHVARADGSDAQWLLASNLSEGGLFVRTAKPPEVGSRLRLDLEARGQTLRFAEAEVIWSRPMDLASLTQGLPGFGVRFLPMGEESTALVKHLVDVGGTGRGQAKTLPFSSPEAIAQASREPLHAPVAAMMQKLLPTERAPTGDWPAITAPPPELRAEPKVVVNFDASEPEPGSTPLDLGEPSLDPESMRAAAMEVRPPSRRRGARATSWLAAGVLGIAAAAGGFFAWRGLQEAQKADDAAGPVTIVTAQELASPEGPGEATAATVEAAAAAQPQAAPTPVAQPAPVVEARPEPKLAAKPAEKPAPRAEPRAPVRPALAQIALPSGAARSVGVSEQGGRLEIQPELAPGSSIDRVFALSAPSRLVIDLKGASPKGTPRVAGREAVTSVRLGGRPGGTRLVLDLARGAGQVKTENGAITVELK